MKAMAVSRLMARLEVATSGYFSEIGWFETRATRRAVDVSKAPIPWFTYPAVALLSERVSRRLRVLEFGSGMGTVWWSRRVEECVAIEHDARWAEQIRAQCDADLHLVDGGSPMRYLAPVENLGRFDVIVVDGLYRCECLAASIQYVTDDGVVILDDAQRTEYAPGIAALANAGFRALPMHGPQPVSKHGGCTVIFYRPGNVLDL